MNRRKFIALGSIASTLAVPAIGRAATMGGADTKLPNLVFTEQDPGHWAALEKLHVPQTETMGDTLTVTTPHPMSEPHYIVSHTVVLEGSNLNLDMPDRLSTRGIDMFYMHWLVKIRFLYEKLISQSYFFRINCFYFVFYCSGSF